MNLRRTRNGCCRAAAAFLFVVSTAVQAQTNPTLGYAEAPKDDAVASGWKVEVKAGLLVTTGNSQATSLSAAGRATRDSFWQKYSLAGDYTYARTAVLVSNGTPVSTLDDLHRQDSLSARLWDVGFRFDQYLIRRKQVWDTSLYATATIASDLSAGKKLLGGVQVGVSTLLLREGDHQLLGELGYDFTYLDPYVGDGYAIHSLRTALAYTWAFSKKTKLVASLEYLTNLNNESGAPNDDPGNPNEVPSFNDHRLNGILGVTTQLYEALSLNVTLTGRYDAKPAFIQLPSSVTLAPGVRGIFLEHLDTITQVQLVYTFG